MYYQKYALVLKKWRGIVTLAEYADTIKNAILTQFPNAQNITIEKTYYSFETPVFPKRGELSAIGRFISHNSVLRDIVVQYDSKNGKHLPSRKLFYCVENNYSIPEKQN